MSPSSLDPRFARRLGVAAALLQIYSLPLRRWMRQMCPILGVAVLLTSVWEFCTTGRGWLPLPYFPGPEGVMAVLASDRALLFDSTWRSLALLLSGYAIGVAIALITGVTIGWFPHARYWACHCSRSSVPFPPRRGFRSQW
jgi:NitT/TauT family transport system permease protein